MQMTIVLAKPDKKPKRKLKFPIRISNPKSLILINNPK